MGNSINGPKRGSNKHARSQVTFCNLQGHISVLHRDNNFYHRLRTKKFDDISAISIVDAGVSHTVVCVRVCVQVTAAVRVRICKFNVLAETEMLKEHVKHLDLC